MNPDPSSLERFPEISSNRQGQGKSPVLLKPGISYLPKEDPFSQKAISELEQEGLNIKWRYGYGLAKRCGIAPRLKKTKAILSP